MLSRIRNSIFTKFLCGLMGLYMLNISVDTADPNPEYIPEDLTYNDQESIVELVVEKVLGFEDAFMEYDDHDSNDQLEKKNVKIDFFIPSLKAHKFDHLQICDIKTFYPFYQSPITKGFIKIDSPPPKV